MINLGGDSSCQAHKSSGFIWNIWQRALCDIFNQRQRPEEYPTSTCHAIKPSLSANRQENTFYCLLMAMLPGLLSLIGSLIHRLDPLPDQLWPPVLINLWPESGSASAGVFPSLEFPGQRSGQKRPETKLNFPEDDGSPWTWKAAWFHQPFNPIRPVHRWERRVVEVLLQIPDQLSVRRV